MTPLAPLVAAAATGRGDRVEAAAVSALAAGCTAAQIREALLTVAPFAGYPRTLDAFAHARAALGGSADDEVEAGSAWTSRGLDMFGRVYGDDADRVLGKLRALDVEVTAWIVDDAYGKVLSRPGLAAAERERLAVVLLAAQDLRNQLPGHVRGALRCGATPQQVAASLDAAADLLPAGGLAAARAALSRWVSGAPP